MEKKSRVSIQEDAEIKSRSLNLGGLKSKMSENAFTLSEYSTDDDYEESEKSYLGKTKMINGADFDPKSSQKLLKNDD